MSKRTVYKACEDEIYHGHSHMDPHTLFLEGNLGEVQEGQDLDIPSLLKILCNNPHTLADGHLIGLDVNLWVKRFLVRRGDASEL